MEGDFSAGDCLSQQTDTWKHLAHIKLNPHYTCSVFTEPLMNLMAKFA